MNKDIVTIKKMSDMGEEYKMGSPYKSINLLLKDLKNGKFVFWRSALKHPFIIWDMRLDIVETAIKNGVIRRAVKNNVSGVKNGTTF